MTVKPKLTVLDPELESKIARTPRGMAHWAGTGPVHTTCRECVSYTFNGYKANRGNKGGMLKDGKCKKFESIGGTEGAAISFELSSCKYFEKNPTPPAIINPRK